MCDSAELPLLGVAWRGRKRLRRLELGRICFAGPLLSFEQKGFSTHFEIWGSSAATSPSQGWFTLLCFPNEGLNRELAWGRKTQGV